MKIKRITYYFKMRIYLLKMKYFQSTKYDSLFQIVYSNLLIAFRNKYSVSKYEKMTRTILFKRFYASVDEALMPEKNFRRSISNYYSLILNRLYKRFPDSGITKRIYNRHEMRKQEILNNPYLKWKYYFKYWHGLKFENFDIIENSLKAGRGALICCFHLGQFRIIADYLNARGFTVKLLIDKKTYELDFKNTEEKLRIKTSIAPGHKLWEYIIAEDVTIALKILNSFHNNEIVVFYLDGNTGSGSQLTKAEVVPFFSQSIYARRGAIQLAITNNTPIIPLTSRFRGLLPASFKVYPEVRIPEEGTIKEKTLCLTQSLYRFFTEIISEDPAEWMLWFVCHLFWVKKDLLPVSQKNNRNEIFHETAEIIRTKKRAKIILDKYNLSYFIGKNYKIALVDIRSGRFFSTFNFLEAAIPKLFRKKMYVNELVDKFIDDYSEEEIILSLASMRQRGYLYFN